MNITCKDCGASQMYSGQQNCICCGKHMSNWSVATQIMLQKEKEKKT